jgi:polyphosphate kinase
MCASLGPDVVAGMTDADVALSAEELEARLESPESYFNRELSWLQFARRVLELAGDPEVPLLERVKFVGIFGMLHDEFFMKRMSGLRRQIARGVDKLSLDGRTPSEEHGACRDEVLAQLDDLGGVVQEIRGQLDQVGLPILEYDDLTDDERSTLRDEFIESVLPVLTPLAVDAAHPFPFISNLGLNLAILLDTGDRERFVRLKVPSNRTRWMTVPGGRGFVPLERVIAVPGGRGFVPLERVIAANLGELFPRESEIRAWTFRLTRGVEGDPDRFDAADDDMSQPGSILRQVAAEIKARRFAGEVRLEVEEGMPKSMREWLLRQVSLGLDDLYVLPVWLKLADLLDLEVEGHDSLKHPVHVPVTHPRLRGLVGGGPDAIFDDIARGDILLHHPYHDFSTSVLRFIEAAAVDDRVLAIKLTIYRTSSDSPIVLALAEAARRGKQVAVLVEITARFDEAPNIAWGRLLENEGVHVAYGVENLKTHVKLAQVVREEDGGVRRYVHVGTGNYHSKTARLYEDVGVLSADPDLAADVAAAFNALTSATPSEGYRKMLVAPHHMRRRFEELIAREIDHARAGRPCGVWAKMNQLSDGSMMRHLYRASGAGVPITLNVRGLSCLRPGVPGLSENIRVYSVMGRFLEHARIYRFENGGDPEVFIGSADWMKRNLNRRVETVTPVTDPKLRDELDEIRTVYDEDNHSAWDCRPDGSYVRRRPADGESPRPAQTVFIERANRRR